MCPRTGAEPAWVTAHRDAVGWPATLSRARDAGGEPWGGTESVICSTVGALRRVPQAAFAAEYGRQWDAHRDARPTAPAWRIAFEAADRERVTATGNLYLALNAHIGRDMPLILARVGLSGTRRADQNMVNIVLYAAMRALMNELAANYDPSLGLDGPGGADELTLYQYVAGLRERAWRLAEQLVAAPTPAARERVQARIEAEAHAAALVLRTAFTSPPGGNAAAERDRYCAAHWTAPS